MNRLGLAFVVLLLLVTVCVQQSGSAPVERQEISGRLDSFVPFDVVADGVSFDLKPLAGANYPSTLSLYYDQIGLVLVAGYANGAKVRLPYHFDIGYDFDGEVHWEKRTNRYALAQYDLNGDGVDEILFAVVAPDDDMISQVGVSVIEYHPPLRESDLSRPQNWEAVSALRAVGVVGSVRIGLEGRSVTIPRNHRDLYYELTWCSGKFRETGNF